MGLSALPTMLRVPLLEQHARIRVVPSGAYGFTESVLPGRDRHHRVSAGAGVAASTKSGFAGELRMDGRYDHHAVKGGGDNSGVIDARAFARYTRALDQRLSLGAQLGVWVPGENAPHPAFKATTVDAIGIASIRASEHFVLTADVGYRLDRSAQSVRTPERLSKADWLSLGLSDFDAALVGIGVEHSLDSLRWFAELTADVFVGKGAPSFVRSPLRAALGASTELGATSRRGSLIAQALLSSRAPVDTGGPLLPFEPRFTVMFALSQDFDLGATQVHHEAPPVEQAAPVEPPPVVHEVVAPPPAVLPPGVLRVFVRDTDRGEVLAAQIRVTSKEGQEIETTQRAAPRGGVELELAPGSYEVEISADGFASQHRRLSIDEQGVTVINIDLRPKRGR